MATRNKQEDMKQTTDTVEIGEALLRGEDTANKEDLDQQIDHMFPNDNSKTQARASNDVTPQPEDYNDLDVSKENETPLMVQLPKSDAKNNNIIQNTAIVPI